MWDVKRSASMLSCTEGLSLCLPPQTSLVLNRLTEMTISRSGACPKLESNHWIPRKLSCMQTVRCDYPSSDDFLSHHVGQNSFQGTVEPFDISISLKNGPCLTICTEPLPSLLYVHLISWPTGSAPSCFLPNSKPDSCSCSKMVFTWTTHRDNQLFKYRTRPQDNQLCKTTGTTSCASTEPGHHALNLRQSNLSWWQMKAKVLKEYTFLSI